MASCAAVPYIAQGRDITGSSSFCFMVHDHGVQIPMDLWLPSYNR